MRIPLNIDWRQILLHALNFWILAGGLYFLLYNPVKKFIAKREEHYRSLDREAAASLASAQAYEAQCKTRLEGVDREIAQKRMKAQAELDAYAALQTKQADAKADKIIADAQKAAAEERQAVLAGADKEILAMAKEAASKIVHASADAAIEQFLDAAERDVDHD